MDEDTSLRRYGLRPSADELNEVREILRAEVLLECRQQGDGDRELMKLCCVQLFNAGGLDDVMRIWEAKESSWDAYCAIDVQLMCGHGLEQTKAYLAANASGSAAAALAYLLECEKAGDFHNFSVQQWSIGYSEYYLPG